MPFILTARTLRLAVVGLLQLSLSSPLYAAKETLTMHAYTHRLLKEIFETTHPCEPEPFTLEPFRSELPRSLDLLRKDKSTYEPYCQEKAQAPLKDFCTYVAPCGPPGYPACWDDDNSSQIERNQNPFWKAQVFKYTIQKFLEYTHSPRLLNTCCEKDDKCKIRFKNTKFQILMGLGVNSQEGHYDANAHAIRATEARLFGCTATECIDRFLLHELGHACSYAINPMQDALATSSNYESGCEDPKNAVYFGFSRLSDKTDACLRLKIIQHYEQYKHHVYDGLKPCLGAWLHEAFADTIFASEYTSPMHFAGACHRLQDADHASPPSYLSCILDTPEVRSNLCEVFGFEAPLAKGP